MMVVGISVMLPAAMMPEVSAGEPHNIEVDIEPGEYQKIMLEDYDSRGDSLIMTLARVVATGDSSTQRSLNYYLIENQYAKQYSHAPEYLLQSKALVYKMNCSDKIYNQEGLKCDQDAQIYLIIDNYWRPGDESGDGNLTAKVKINYSVEPHVPEEGLPVFLIILALIVFLVVAGAIIGFILWKKNRKVAVQPVSVQQGSYFVYRGMDGSIYYLSNAEYTHMNNNGSILNYEYMGQADMIGGVAVMGSVQAPMNQGGGGLDLSMVAQPVGAAAYQEQGYYSQDQVDPYPGDRKPAYPLQPMQEEVQPSEYLASDTVVEPESDPLLDTTPVEEPPVQEGGGDPEGLEDGRIVQGEPHQDGGPSTPLPPVAPSE